MTFNTSATSVPKSGTPSRLSSHSRHLRHRQVLEERLAERTATIGVVGLGYVGLPLAVAYANERVRSIGFDLSADKVDMINDGRNYIQDVNTHELFAAVEANHDGSPFGDTAHFRSFTIGSIANPAAAADTTAPDSR